MKVESVLISEIKVGARRREDFGDIQGLAESIGKYGLFHPIVIDSDLNLVAGERRLRACRDVLGCMEIDARHYSELTEDERREIELEENVRRKDLTPAERSRVLVALASTAQENISKELSVKNTEKSNGRGRPQKPDSKDKVAERIGVPRETIKVAEKHVEAVNKYPELAAPGIPQKDAIEIAKSLDAMPEGERAEARSRFISGDTNTKAMLAGKPPLPPPVPKPKKSAAANWLANFAKARQMFTGIKENGGIARITSEWSDEEKGAFLSELEGMRSELSNVITELEAETYAVS